MDKLMCAKNTKSFLKMAKCDAALLRAIKIVSVVLKLSLAVKIALAAACACSAIKKN